MIDGWLVFWVGLAVAVSFWVLHRLGDKSDPPNG